MRNHSSLNQERVVIFPKLAAWVFLGWLSLGLFSSENAVAQQIQITNPIKPVTPTGLPRPSSQIAKPNFPDLAVSAVSTDVAVIPQGGKFKVLDTTTNIGSSPAPAATYTKYYLSYNEELDNNDMYLGQRPIGANLGAGANVTAEVSFQVSSIMTMSSYYVVACADGAGTVEEADEGNNCRFTTSKINVANVDFQVTNLQNPPTKVPRGLIFGAFDNTKLTGMLLAKTPMITRFYLSLDKTVGNDVPIGERTAIFGLVKDEISSAGANVTIPTTIAFGSYYLLACADDTGVAAETNEGNNCRFSDFKVEVAASVETDLLVTSVSFDFYSISTVHAGANFSGFDNTKVQKGYAMTTTYTKYYLSSDQAAGRVYLGQRTVTSNGGSCVGSNGSVSLQIPQTTAKGSYYLVACADGTNAIVETDENNNCLSSSAMIKVE